MIKSHEERTLWEKFKYLIFRGSLRRYVGDVYYWFAYRFSPKRRYHMLNLGTKPGYSDVCERLLHANFALLKEFIEIEEPFVYINWEATPEHSHAAKEMKELYNWWVNVRPKREELDPINLVEPPKRIFVPSPDGKPYSTMRKAGTPEEEAIWEMACEESCRLEAFWNEEDSNNIKRLVDIRLFLWT